MNIIKLRNVKKSFKNIELFDNVNMDIEKGKIYGLVGPNGSGKSVLFKIICGFIKPDEGEVLIHPDFMNTRNNFPSSFGLIIDRPAYISNKTGFENLKRLASIQNKISETHIKSTMKKVGLDWTIKQKVEKYSLGMKQKLAIAQAIMEEQDVLILDEPFNGLDEDSIIVIRHLLIQLNNEGKTIVLTSHNKEDILALCDVVYKVKNQTLILQSEA